MSDHELLRDIKFSLNYLCFMVTATIVFLPWIIKWGIEAVREEESKKDK